tara:strand:- start:11447 stop:11767 length:321 start_codon:yes stop_codon:yes gene_type:complete
MMGMGTLEVLVILLVAFVLLGPEKMISGAKSLGSLFAQAKSVMDDVTNIDLDSFNEDKLTRNKDSEEVNTDEEDPNTNMIEPIPFGRKVKPYSEDHSDVEDGKKDA